MLLGMQLFAKKGITKLWKAIESDCKKFSSREVMPLYAVQEAERRHITVIFELEKLDSIQDLTGIKPGETDPDLKFSLETVNCVGCCALGPVMVIDGDYHGKIAPAKSEDVLKNYE